MSKQQNSQTAVAVPEVDYTDAPKKLREALDYLKHCSDNDLIDVTANDTGKTFRATMAVIEDCFECLCEIHQGAIDAVMQERKYHRRCLADIDSIGLPE